MSVRKHSNFRILRPNSTFDGELNSSTVNTSFMRFNRNLRKTPPHLLRPNKAFQLKGRTPKPGPSLNKSHELLSDNNQRLKSRVCELVQELSSLKDKESQLTRKEDQLLAKRSLLTSVLKGRVSELKTHLKCMTQQIFKLKDQTQENPRKKLTVENLQNELQRKNRQILLLHRRLSKKLPPKKKPPRSSQFSAEVSATLAHLALRMQLLKIPKSELLPTLLRAPPPSLTATELQFLLQQGPFRLTSLDNVEFLIDFLTEGESSGTSESIGKKLVEYTEDWTLLTREEEDQIDTQLYQLVHSQKLALKRQCEVHDTEKTGFCTTAAFFNELRSLAGTLSPQLLKYLSLLFYSYSQSLTQVPYAHFLQAYGQPEENEGRLGLVGEYLELIARSLLKHHKTVRGIFIAKRGVVSAPSFTQGLQNLGLSVSSDTVQLLLEGLRYSEDSGVHIEELEELFEDLGVNREYQNTVETDRSLDSN